MALTLDLYDSFLDSSVSLISTSGLDTVYNTFKPATPANHTDSVISTFVVTLQGTSDDNLASQLITLGRMFERAKQYKQDDTQGLPVILRAQLTAETGTRRAIVYGGGYALNESPNAPQVIVSHIISLTLTIEHLPWMSFPISTWSTTPQTCLGGYCSVVVGGSGDLPGIPYVEFGYDTGAISDIWCGFRSARKHKAVAGYFTPVWDCKDGTMIAADTSLTGDATAHGGTRVTTTFATSAAMIERFVITVNDAVIAPDSQSGRFLVLARMKLSSGSDTVYAQIRSGWYSSAVTPGYRYSDPVQVSGTSWKLYELGTVKLPPITDGLVVNDVMLQNAAISFMAQRAVGSTSALHIDCFGMLPIDEGFAKISGLSLSGATDSVILTLTQRLDADFSQYNAGYKTALTDFALQNFFIPSDESESCLYMFAQRSGVSTLGDKLTFTGRAYRRYSSLRGAA